MKLFLAILPKTIGWRDLCPGAWPRAKCDEVPDHQGLTIQIGGPCRQLNHQKLLVFLRAGICPRELPPPPPPLTGTIPSRPCLSSVKGYAWPQLKAIFILSNTVDPLIVFPALLSGRTFSSCLDICMGICWSPCFEGSKGIPGFVFFLFSLAILPYLFQLVARYYGEPYKIPWRMRVGIKKGLEEN